MPHVAYIDPPEGSLPIADAMRARRGGHNLLPLDKVLLNAPSIAAGWNHLLGAVRTSTTELPADIKEMVILRVAALNEAAFEWEQHEPLATQEGVTRQQLVAIRDTSFYDAPAFRQSNHSYRDYLSEVMHDVKARYSLYITDQLTIHCKVDPHLINALKKLMHLESDTWLTELISTISAYNMVSRFLNGLDVDAKSNLMVPLPSSRLRHQVHTHHHLKILINIWSPIDGDDVPLIFLVTPKDQPTYWSRLAARLAPHFILVEIQTHDAPDGNIIDLPNIQVLLDACSSAGLDPSKSVAVFGQRFDSDYVDLTDHYFCTERIQDARLRAMAKQTQGQLHSVNGYEESERDQQGYAYLAPYEGSFREQGEYVLHAEKILRDLVQKHP